MQTYGAIYRELLARGETEADAAFLVDSMVEAAEAERRKARKEEARKEELMKPRN